MRSTRTLFRLLVAMAAAFSLVTLSPMSAQACNFGGGTGDGGVNIGGHCPGGGGSPGGYTPGQPYVPPHPPPPVYEDYWTPACSINGPPDAGGNSEDVMCMGAASGCKYRGVPNAIMMRHYRREVGTTQWNLVGTECRGPGDPVHTEPQVTQEMVLDQAYVAAPHPAAYVQPGNRSFVNLPNNYWAQADPVTTPVDVLGHAIPVQFTVDDVTWKFGDGSTASGKGIKDADVGAPGAVEHAYLRDGSYSIVVTTRVGAHFTLPTGQRIDLPGAFEFDSTPVVLPVGEIETRVDATS